VLLVEEMEPGLVRDMWVNLVGPAPTQKGLQKKLGKNMAEEGWAPKLPIVIVPGTLRVFSFVHSFTHSLTHSRTTSIGFGSTGLEVIEGYEKWKGERVWLSISKIGGQALSIRSRLSLSLSLAFLFSPHSNTHSCWCISCFVLVWFCFVFVCSCYYLHRRQVQQLKAARKLATVGRSGGLGASSAGENTNPQLTAEDIAFKVSLSLLPFFPPAAVPTVPPRTHSFLFFSLNFP
jgi:hypothetical protein